MFAAGQCHEGIVVEHRELGPPPDQHGVSGLEHDPHGGAQVLWPLLDRPDRCARPVQRPYPGGHLTLTSELGRGPAMRVEAVVVTHRTPPPAAGSARRTSG